MASKGDVEVVVTADDSSFQATMSKVASTFKDTFEQGKGHVEGLGSVLEKATGALAAFAAVAAGGAFFSKAISETTKYTGEVGMLSRQLGISTQEASGLNVALGDIGSNADSYTGALSKLTKQVRTNEAGLNAMGIATRDSNNQYLNGKALMDSATAGLMNYKEGTDRNLAAQVAYGKGAQEAAALLKLTIPIQEEAAKKAAELGLVLSDSDVAASKAFKMAMNDVGDVLQAVEIAIGQAVMPVLTKLATWFSEGGPSAVALFKPIMVGVGEVLSIVGDTFMELWDTASQALGDIGNAFKDSGVGVQSWGEFVKNVFTVIEVVLLTFKAAIVVTFEVIRGAIDVVIAELSGFANVASAAFRLDWKGVRSAWTAGLAGVEKAVSDSAGRIMAKSNASGQAIADALNGVKVPTAPTAAKNKGTRSFTDPNGGSKTGRLEDTSKAEYAVAKAQFEAALSLQKEYLKEAQSASDDAYKHNLIGIREYYDARIATEQQEIALEMQAKQKEIDATQKAESTATTDRERLTLKAQEIKLTGELTVLTAQYAQVAVTETRAMTEAERQRADALREVAIASQVNIGNSRVAMDRIALDTRRQLRQTSEAQAIEEEKGFEDRITAIQRDALTQRLAMEKAGTNDPVRIAGINAQLEELERQHQEKLTQLDASATVERNRYATEAANAIQGNFETFFNDLTDRTKKLSDVFKDLGKSILASLNQASSKKLAEQLFGAGSSGGGLLNSLTTSLLGGSAAPGKAGASAGGTDAATAALAGLAGQTQATTSGMQSLSTDGLGGMFKSAGDWITKTIFGTTAQAAETTATTTGTSALAALSTAAYGAATALSSVSAGGGNSGASSSIFGSLLGGSGGAGGEAAADAGGSFLDWFSDVGGAFLASGTDFVPRDMLAYIHRGEAIVPAAQNTRTTSGHVLNQTITVPSGTSTASATQVGTEVAQRTQAALARNS